MAGAGVPVPMDDGLAMRGCGRLGTPHRKALSDRAAVYYNSRVRSWGLGRLQEMLRLLESQGEKKRQGTGPGMMRRPVWGGPQAAGKRHSQPFRAKRLPHPRGVYQGTKPVVRNRRPRYVQVESTERRAP